MNDTCGEAYFHEARVEVIERCGDGGGAYHCCAHVVVFHLEMQCHGEVPDIRFCGGIEGNAGKRDTCRHGRDVQYIAEASVFHLVAEQPAKACECHDVEA